VFFSAELCPQILKFSTMKRKNFFILIVISAVVSFAVLNVSNHTDSIKFTDIFLDNVEALAQESNDPNCIPVKGVCSNTIFTPGYLSLQ